MGVLSYSAIGTAMIRGPQYKLDLAKLETGFLMSSDGRNTPSAEQVRSDAGTPLAQRLREEMLQSMGLRQDDLGRMDPRTRSDLEANLATYIHEQILSSGVTADGALLDMRA